MQSVTFEQSARVDTEDQKRQLIDRDGLLDGIRAIAVARVIVWHATGWWWVTWLVSSIPVMFVVTGFLLARSFQKAGITRTLIRRWARLQVPLIFWSVVVLTLSELIGSRHSSWISFVIPVREPFSEIGGEWFTTPLWYVRAYVWVLVLAPLLWRMIRFKPLVTMATGVMATGFAGIYTPVSGSIWWMLSDVALYGTFTALGMYFHQVGLPKRSPAVAMVALTSLVLGSTLAVVSPPPQGVVNNSHLLHLLLGAFWTFALFLSGPTVRRLASARLARELNNKPLTVYLWHSPLAWAFWQILPDNLTGVGRAVVVTALTFLCVPLLARGVGLFEELGQRRVHLRATVLSVPITILLLVPFVISYAEGRLDFRSAPSGAPLPPSQAPVIERVRIDSDVIAFTESPPTGGLASLQRQKKLEQVLKRAKQNLGVRSLRAMITTREGETWFRNLGVSRPLSSPSFIGSITKTFTTALVMDAVERGEVDLDMPIGDLGIDFKYTSITLRQLIRHRAGVPRTSVASGIIFDGVTPQDVARWVSTRPLDYEPGTSYKYSTTGFVLVGLVLERATGTPFDVLLQDRIAGKLGLELDVFTGRYRSVGYSTGGVVMGLDQLAKWARIYVDDRGATSRPWPWAIRQTTGFGIHGYCPCEGGSFTALGHMGGRTFMSVDGDGVVVILDTDGVLVGDNLSKTVAAAHELRLIAGGGRTNAWIAE